MNLDYILVIDDNRDVRSVVVSTLVQAGYLVREANSGHEGIQMVIHQRPALIICDVKMPGLNGYHTLEAVRKCSNTAAIPFILITGSMGPNDFRNGMASGADDYLTKPFTPQELIASVKSRFARRADMHTDFFKRAEKEQPAVSKQLRSAGNFDAIDAAITAANLPVFCLD